MMMNRYPPLILICKKGRSIMTLLRPILVSIDAALETIRSHSVDYANVLGSFTEAEFRGEVEIFGRRATRGAMILNMVYAGCAAYRTQIFLCLRAVERDELGTMDLWAGMDSPSQATV